jgi:alpha-1,2-mannosyltransferase
MDFLIYRDALAAFKTLGPLNAYQTSGLAFTYTPLMLWLFQPLGWLASTPMTYGIWQMLNWGLVVVNFALVVRIVQPAKQNLLSWVFLILMMVERFWDHNANYGQSNQLILLMLLLSLKYFDTQPWLSALSMAVGIAFKLTPALFLIYALLRKRMKWVGLTVGWLVGLNILAAFLLAGDQGVALLGKYVLAIKTYGPSQTELTFNHSLLKWMSLGFPVLPKWISQILLITAAIGVIGVIRTWRSPLHEWSLVMLLMLLISPVTWIHHFVLLTLPAAVFSKDLISRHQPLLWLGVAGLLFWVWGGLNLLPSVCVPNNQECLGGFTWATLGLGLLIVMGMPNTRGFNRPPGPGTETRPDTEPPLPENIEYHRSPNEGFFQERS